MATPIEREWLAAAIPGRTYEDAAAMFADVFGRSLTREQVKNFASRNGISGARKRRPKNSIWDDEREAYFIEIVPGRTEREISDLFEERFGIPLSESRINNAKRKLGVKSGTHGGRFQKGIVPWTKGRSIDEWMPEDAKVVFKANQFKAGHGVNDLPLGSEYVDKDGYVYVKVRMESGTPRFGRGGKWKSRAAVEWERVTGEDVPEGHRLIHLNKVVDDDRFENLALVSIEDYPVINMMGAPYFDADSLQVCKDIAALRHDVVRRRRCANE